MADVTHTHCHCVDSPDLVVEEFVADHEIAQQEIVNRYGPTHWWLSMRICRACSQHWLVAQEERFNDVWIMRKMSKDAAAAASNGIWPNDFDHYETLLRIGQEYGHQARYANPWETTPILIDLIGQRPAITDAEIAALVNLPLQLVPDLSRNARHLILVYGFPFDWTRFRAETNNLNGPVNFRPAAKA